jgi:bifunctional DNA primase/polymerase-like protein
MLTPAGDMTTTDAAKHLLSYGFHLIPLLPKSKKPGDGDGWQERAIHQSGDAHKLKGGNIGVLGGSPVSDSRRLLVLDIDAKNDAGGPESVRRLQSIYGPLPATATVQTPNDGYHLYYSVPEDRPLCGISNLLKKLRFSGIDLIGDGLYVVAPPSVLERGSYRWTRCPSQGLSLAPVWLENLLKIGGRPGPLACNVTQRKRLPGHASRFLGPDALAELLEEVIARYPLQKAGQRNDHMHRAVGSLFRRGLSATQVREVMLRWHEHFDSVFATPFLEAIRLLDQCIAITLCNIEKRAFSLAPRDHQTAQEPFQLTTEQRAFLDGLPMLPSSTPSLLPSLLYSKSVRK